MVSSIPNRLSYPQKFSYGVGHVFNDLCASMWFSYLLVFFEKVVEFSHKNAGLVLLVGQLADGFSTPIVGIFSDKENKIDVCARYGRRKVWHLLGTICVVVSFPFIFSRCLGCEEAKESLQLLYYCIFVIIFQFGWACVQISHLSLIPELTTKKHSRTELNSIRYAFTVLANLSVYAVAFIFLESSEESKNEPDVTTISSVDTSTPADKSSSSITPDDADEFRNMAIFCICTGMFFSAIFHIGVREPPFVNKKKTESTANLNKIHRMRKLDWFKEMSFYQVALLYMATRLYVNLYQVYIPLYVQDTLELSKSAIAVVPFVMYLAGFLGSLIMKQVNKLIGRKGTFSMGCVIGLIGCIAIAFGTSEAYVDWGVYCVAAILGIGGSTVLITCLSITSDLIGENVEGGAFVYGFMSLVDKISNGVIIMIIQTACTAQPKFYQNVITYGCGSSLVLGLIVIVSLIPVKIGNRKGAAKVLAEIIDDEGKSTETDLKSPPEENQIENTTTITKQYTKPEVFNDKIKMDTKIEEGIIVNNVKSGIVNNGLVREDEKAV